MKIEFWFDFASTYSYPAALRLEALAATKGITIIWRSFLLGAIFNQHGWNDSPFNIFPLKGQYMWRDLERSCENFGIPFKRPSVFPRSALLAARVVARFSNAPWVPSFVRDVYAANFAKDLDISSPEVILACLNCANEDAESIIEEAQSAESKINFKAQTDEAYQRGIFGAPSFLIGKELFWGNDRLEEALDWAVKNPA